MIIAVFVGLWIVNIAVVFIMTDKVIDAVKEASILDHGRVIYESDDTGTLTVYPDNAILELLDGTVVVIPKMQEAYDDQHPTP